MNFEKKDKDFFKSLAKEIKKRDNPTDLKDVVFGFVKIAQTPITVTTEGGAFTLIENDNLFISEQFRFRCNIDKTTLLSEGVPSDLSNSETEYNNAKLVTETHSASGSPCNMPSAIDLLAQAIENTNNAITKVNNELLAIKCVLNVGDMVILAPVGDMHGSYILLDKVIV